MSMKSAALAAAALGTTWAAPALPAASAQGLLMCYDVVDLGNGLFEYEFTISTDVGWRPGMGWRWLIFGDAPRGTLSPIRDFSVYPESFPVGPWEKIVLSEGGHNGPTFARLNGAVLDFWIPATSGEVLTWVGDSRTNVAPGEMLFSTLAGTTGGAIAADFEVAEPGCRVTCPCACNFDTSTGFGVCDLFDFLAFQNGFAVGDPCACDFATAGLGGVCDLFDFLQFQVAFVSGCP